MTIQRCSVPECPDRAARGHLWCQAHVIAHAVTVRGGYMTIEQAREAVRRGAREADYMADDDDWIAR